MWNTSGDFDVMVESKQRNGSDRDVELSSALSVSGCIQNQHQQQLLNQPMYLHNIAL